MANRRRTTPPRNTSGHGPSPDPVRKYAEDVVHGRTVAGKLVRLACKRHLKDLKDGSKRGLHFDIEAATWAINFFPTVLRLAEGEHAGHPFDLQAWQKFVIGSLFGWKGKDGYRRFRTGYVEVGKGNGKSPMAGGIGLYMMTADGEMGAHCYAAATTRDQAGILFRDAVKMVDASAALSSRIQKSGKREVHNLAHLASGSFFRPVSSEGRSLDGKRVHYAALDEVHEHPSPMVVDKMRAGTKGRRQALIFEITNSGFDRKSVCYAHHDYSRKVLEDRLQDDSWFAYVCQLDEGDDWRNPKVWVKANPNLGISITVKYLEEQVREALGMPIKQNIVKRLNFCVWTEQAERWMPVELWDSRAAHYSEADLLKLDCFGGLDLASTRDLAALLLVFPGAKLRILPYFWIPEENIAKRSEKSGVPYDVWVREGFIEATPGDVIDYDAIRKRINELGDKFAFREVGFDPWNATQIATQLTGDGFPMVEVRQGYRSMTEPTKQLMALIQSATIEHNANPVLNWMMANVAVSQDPAGNLKPDKSKSTEKIDGVVALVIGLSRQMVNPDSGSIYEKRGVEAI
jgi:phage terminase large subunit-like protein